MGDQVSSPAEEAGLSGLKAGPASFPAMVYRWLSSSRLALFLLATILACCVAGVTLFRGPEAWNLIFSALWFNGLLVLLVVNVGFCFFGRIWGRKLTLVSTGMILFHLSFISVFCGVVYNSLFSFDGMMRLTEGETLPNGQRESYDSFTHGQFFDLRRLRGETTLVEMKPGYRVDGADKRAGYDIEVGETGRKARDTIYVTRHLDHRGFRYFCDREGYSVLTVLSDANGDLFGGYIPLQSYRQADETYVYSTGTREQAGAVAFPPAEGGVRVGLQLSFWPDPISPKDGKVLFQVWSLPMGEAPLPDKPTYEGRVSVGETFSAGKLALSVREVRYWATTNIQYDPGQPIVLASLWVGFGGVVMTFFGRLLRKKAVTAGGPESEAEET